MARTKGRKRKFASRGCIHQGRRGSISVRRFHVVAVSEDLDTKPGTYGSRRCTNDLHRLAEWLKGLGIATVAI